jgi:hypothetical protein
MRSLLALNCCSSKLRGRSVRSKVIRIRILVLVIMASLSGKHGLARFCIWTFYSVSSVAVAADADAWSPEANAATRKRGLTRQQTSHLRT